MGPARTSAMATDRGTPLFMSLLINGAIAQSHNGTINPNPALKNIANRCRPLNRRPNISFETNSSIIPLRAIQSAGMAWPRPLLPQSLWIGRLQPPATQTNRPSRATLQTVAGRPPQLSQGLLKAFGGALRSLTRRPDRSYRLGRVHATCNHTNDHRRGCDYGNNQPFQTKRFLMAV